MHRDMCAPRFFSRPGEPQTPGRHQRYTRTCSSTTEEIG